MGRYHLTRKRGKFQSENDARDELRTNEQDDEEILVNEEERQVQSESGAREELGTDEQDDEEILDNEEQEQDLLVRKWTIQAKRKLAKENLQKQATKMLRLSNNKFVAATVGNNNVRVPVPEFDRGKCAPRNIIGVVMEADEEKSLYRIGTSLGVLNAMFTRSQFEICQEKFMSVEDVPSGKSLSVRECHGKTAITGAQGYYRCNCKTGCTGQPVQVLQLEWTEM